MAVVGVHQRPAVAPDTFSGVACVPLFSGGGCTDIHSHDPPRWQYLARSKPKQMNIFVIPWLKGSSWRGELKPLLATADIPASQRQAKWRLSCLYRQSTEAWRCLKAGMDRFKGRMFSLGTAISTGSAYPRSQPRHCHGVGGRILRHRGVSG